jgi:hypothetical protein
MKTLAYISEQVAEEHFFVYIKGAAVCLIYNKYLCLC